MKKNIITTFAVALVVAGLYTSTSFADSVTSQSYHYINTVGELQTVIAESPEAAMRTAENISPTSGVIKSDNYYQLASVAESVDTKPSAQYTYKYIATDGSLRQVLATSWQNAIATAVDMLPNSGVWLQ